MTDTGHFWLTRESAGNTDLLAETPCYLTDITEHLNKERVIISGNLGCMKIFIYESGISIRGSLSKYFLDDNFQTLFRSDIQRAIEQMSDEIHLPVMESKVTRIDIAQNFITNYKPECYYDLFGECRYFSRLIQPQSLYYSNNNRIKVFYNKIIEGKKKGYVIPDIWHNSYVLRYEYRLKAKALTIPGRNTLKAGDLYDEQVYIYLVNEYVKEYENINKLHYIKFNLENMKTPNDFLTQLALKKIQELGQNEVMTMIEDLRAKQVFNKKEYYSRLKGKIRELCKQPEITESSELIDELNEKIRAVKQNYR